MHAIQSYEMVALPNLPAERVNELFSLVNEYWNLAHSYYMIEQRHNRYENIEQLRAEGLKSKIIVLIDKKNDKIAGSIQFTSTYQKTDAYFGTLCIGKNYQGSGLSLRLIELAEQETIRSNRQCLYIWVVGCAHQLKNFYSRIGFLETGKVIPREESFLARVKPEFKAQVHFQEMIKFIPSKL